MWQERAELTEIVNGLQKSLKSGIHPDPVTSLMETFSNEVDVKQVCIWCLMRIPDCCFLVSDEDPRLLFFVF